MMDNNTTLGVILCGGKSTRMGTDKGLLKLASTPWAQVAADKMKALQIPVVLSINTAQLNEYSSFFDASILIADDPQLDIYGPLRGVLSVHKCYPGKDLFVLACDMPLIDISILQQLLEVYLNNKNFDSFIFSNEQEPEPVCGIYTSRALAQILRIFESGQLAKHSLKFILEQLNTLLTPLKEDQKKYFINANSPAALIGL